ncbi:MAG: NADH-quinone oxidoreductase subunit [Acidobacteriaceae bacterium]|nr:NADH-quinone oxidoreductase subunit [Acidobacteriaceae bacterium]
MASTVWIVRYLWLIPALPIVAAGIGALLKRSQRKLAAILAIGAMSISFVFAVVAFAHLLLTPARLFINVPWMQFGNEWVSLGWVLDPLAAVMLVMVTFVGLLIFIYSVAYMHHDENFTRFFCFLSLFAGAMLGVLIANSLLLLFMCWEVVGLTSYLLIGFWYERPAAAAAAKKAFITTRIGDLGLLLGMVWLYGQTGTLLFYDHGAGCMEHTALSLLATQTIGFGMATSTGIALLIFCGAVGKSGQLPLHVWLPDAMEGPTPVSALIHAATMVAAGVYLVARVYPLMNASAGGALEVVAWVGALTAIFAALVAVAQDDIKRILAYSTVSQLGYMMMGIGVGGVAVGVFHLIAHAFFKALLFLGAGSVIHGLMGEQDIREMGGIRKWMPVTFATYAVGTLALCGFPLVFSGFWSKDAILHAAYGWNVSRVPFYLGALGALLTAFYMTRQVCYVFFGTRRRDPAPEPIEPTEAAASDPHEAAHESPATMTTPLVMLAIFAILLGFVGTPAWPWLQDFLDMRRASLDFGQLAEGGLIPLMLASSLLVFAGLTLGWWIYGRRPIQRAANADALEQLQPSLFHALRRGFFIDELYALTILRLAWWMAVFANWLDRWVWSGIPLAVSALTRSLGWVDFSLDRWVVNKGFDEGCNGVADGGRWLARLQDGRIQNYLRLLAAAVAALAFYLLLGHRG